MEEKLTAHRLAVLEIVRAGKDHPTARQVFERSALYTPRLSFATVYNALKYLTEKKYLRTIRVGDDALRYDPIEDRHDHLVCRVCGGIEDVMGGTKPMLPQGIAGPNGFQVEDISIQYLGVCAKCRPPEASATKITKAKNSEKPGAKAK
ncbi:MAG: transcriptional repressor [Fibrobacterota bacterium]|nr:transcriptional repressor [Fibrobacterota bacterium]